MGDIIYFAEKIEEMSIGNLEICILQTLPNGKLVLGLQQSGIIDKRNLSTDKYEDRKIIKMN